MSVDTANRWERAFAKKQQKLIPTTTNLVDEVWTSRPPPEINPVLVHPLEFAGRSVEDKLKDLREKLVKEKARAIVLSALDEVISRQHTNHLYFCYIVKLKGSICIMEYLYCRLHGCIMFVGVMLPTVRLFMLLL